MVKDTAHSITDAVKNAARSVGEGTEDLLTTSFAFWTGFEQASVRVRGSGSKPAPGEIRVKPFTENLPEGSVVQLSVDDNEGEIVVRVDHFPPSNTPPLLMLARIGEEGQTRVEGLERVYQADYLIARFEGIDPGDYIITFEPSSSNS
jgi:hypothetical protein